MGASSSSVADLALTLENISEKLGVSKIEKTIDELTELMMPSYFIRNATVTERDVFEARASWKHITKSTSPLFIQNKKSEDFSYSSCLTWFYDSFYERLFDVNPSARPLFKHCNIQSQGRILVSIISTALNQLEEKVSFNFSMEKLAHNHSKFGVRVPVAASDEIHELRHTPGYGSFSFNPECDAKEEDDEVAT
eukprot:gene41878-55560_t